MTKSNYLNPKRTNPFEKKEKFDEKSILATFVPENWDCKEMKVIVVEYFVEYNLRCRLSNEIFLNREPIVKDFLLKRKDHFVGV